MTVASPERNTRGVMLALVVAARPGPLTRRDQTSMTHLASLDLTLSEATQLELDQWLAAGPSTRYEVLMALVESPQVPLFRWPNLLR
ncbi:hypothetical protein [Streptomyces sp. NPDC001903]|uniref:hypothetical protein n=1 Tax=Streptomyces sp. NPDC001903 TaxID=3364622 RepID=UPI0036941C5D